MAELGEDVAALELAVMLLYCCGELQSNRSIFSGCETGGDGRAVDQHD